jgi:hypothetical protein
MHWCEIIFCVTVFVGLVLTLYTLTKQLSVYGRGIPLPQIMSKSTGPTKFLNSLISKNPVAIAAKLGVNTVCTGLQKGADMGNAQIVKIRSEIATAKAIAGPGAIIPGMAEKEAQLNALITHVQSVAANLTSTCSNVTAFANDPVGTGLSVLTQQPPATTVLPQITTLPAKV